MTERKAGKILSLIAASHIRPLAVLSIWRSEDGWWQAWQEPVLFVALVEKTYADDEIGQEMIPVAYDVNARWGLSTVDEIIEDRALSSHPNHACVVTTDASWEEIMDAVGLTQSLYNMRS